MKTLNSTQDAVWTDETYSDGIGSLPDIEKEAFLQITRSTSIRKLFKNMILRNVTAMFFRYTR